MKPLLLKKLNSQPELLSDQADQQHAMTAVSKSTTAVPLSDLEDDAPELRVRYLAGTRAITLPGDRHKVVKGGIAGLLSAFFEKNHTRFYGLGSTTFKAATRSKEQNLMFLVAVALTKRFQTARSHSCRPAAVSTNWTLTRAGTLSRYGLGKTPHLRFAAHHERAVNGANVAPFCLLAIHPSWQFV